MNGLTNNDISKRIIDNNPKHNINGNKLIQTLKKSFAQEEEFNPHSNFCNFNEKNYLNFNPKLILNRNTINSKNLDFIPRNKISTMEETGLKIQEEGKCFQRSEFKPKTISISSSNQAFRELKNMPQTSLEKFLKTMNKIKGKLLFYDENDLAQEVDWVIKEILIDKMYKMKIHEQTTKEESDFYNEFSINKNEIILSNEISKIGKFLFYSKYLYFKKL